MTYLERVSGLQQAEAHHLLETIVDHVSGILEGSLTPSARYQGFGGSLVVYGLTCLEVLPDSRHRAFLIQAQYMMLALGESILLPAGPKERKKVVEEKQPRTGSQLVCRILRCNRRPGFTNLGTGEEQWWVCGSCKRPTERWFTSQGDDVLNLFREGPLSGMVYESSTLLTDVRLANAVLGYSYTQEIIKSELTGRTARVWLYTGETPDSVTQSAQPGATVPTNEGSKMSTPETPAVPEATEAPAPAAPVAPVNVADLLPKRNELKLSRTKVAEKADITVAQLYRIEQGGKRTTEDEAAKVRQALVELEAEQPAPAPAGEATEGAANPE